MRGSWLVALVVGVGLGACFSDDEGFVCSPGEGGCECNEGICLEGLECTSGFCTRTGCDPGTEFCVCDEGTCVGDLECFEGIVCRPKKGKGDPTGGDGSETSVASAEASGSATTASSSTDTTAATVTGDSGDSGDSGGACDPACAECTTCNVQGQCVPDPGIPCSGPDLQCADYVHGLQDGTCYALAPGRMGAVCNSQGACVPAIAMDCDPSPGRVIASCDWECVSQPGLCTMFTPASGVVLDAFCEQDGTTAECATFCFNGSYSQVNVNVCQGGTCIEIDSIDCNAYACENAMCNTSCSGETDCAMFFTCDLMSSMCLPE